MIRLLALTLLCLGLAATLVGCRKVRTVTNNELEVVAGKWKEPKASRWYYMGNKDNFEYFVHYDIGTTEYYRVGASEIKAQHPIPFSREWKNWRFMCWGIAAIDQKISPDQMKCDPL